MTLVATEASPAAETTETQAATAPAVATETNDANPAASSTVDATDAKEPANLLSVIKDAVEKPAEADSSTVEGGEGKPASEEAPETVATEDKADDADLPFHTHPRWKELVAERNELRPDAESYRKITAFMGENHLTAPEVAEGFDVMAKLKSDDPAALTEVLEYLEPRVAYLKERLGFVLPTDLQERVDSGLIDEDGAQELARARATEKLRSDQAEKRDQETSQQREARERADAATGMATAVDGWEKRIKASDPDYPKKAKLVERTAQAIVQQTGKPPATPEEAVALVEQALAEVNEQFKSLLPKPRPIAANPQGSSTPTVIEAKTLRDAVRNAVNR